MKTPLEIAIQKTVSRFLLASIILLSAAIALSVIWNRSIKDELSIQAASFVRKGITSKEMRGVIEYLNGVQFSAFTHVSLFTLANEHIITLPPIFDRKNKVPTVLDQVLYSSITLPIYLDTEAKNLAAIAEFTYSRFELVPYAFLIWIFSMFLLTIVFIQAKKKIENEFQKEVRLKNAELIEEIAKKVRHNIRSPLASLRAIFIEKMFSPETIYDQGIGVITRLEEIIEGLKPENISTQSGAHKSRQSQKKAIFDVSAILRSLIAEKKLIKRNVSIELKSDLHFSGVYTDISSSELKAMLSNILDNSLQAIGNPGKIEVLLTSDDVSFSIDVIDNGCGISMENLNKVFDQFFTFGKKDGTGLGLYYAKKLIEESLGNIEISSKLNEGTKLSIILPRISTPSWHVDELSLSNSDHVVICDDQQSIRDAWKLRLNTGGIQKSIQEFTTCEELETKVDFNIRHTFMVDFDLGQGKMTGIDFLKRHQDISDRFILVTGHFDEPWLQDECERLKCKLLPKDYIFQTPIK